MLEALAWAENAVDRHGIIDERSGRAAVTHLASAVPKVTLPHYIHQNLLMSTSRMYMSYILQALATHSKQLLCLGRQQEVVLTTQRVYDIGWVYRFSGSAHPLTSCGGFMSKRRR